MHDFLRLGLAAAALARFWNQPDMQAAKAPVVETLSHSRRDRRDADMEDLLLSRQFSVVSYQQETES
jgi:hypothetical protein